MALPGRFFLRRKMASMLRRSTVEGEEVCEEVLCEEISWPDAKAEAEMYLLTASARATVLKERQDKARSELRKMARDALFDRACRVIQRAARAASARAASSRPREEEREESKALRAEVRARGAAVTLLEARARSLCLRRRNSVECARLERELAEDALRLWQLYATPLSTRAAVWRDCFTYDERCSLVKRMVKVARAERVVENLKRESASYGSGEVDRAERKALYLALKANGPNIDLEETYRTFRLFGGFCQKKKNRRLIEAFFTTAEVAPISAILVQQLFCCCQRKTETIADLDDEEQLEELLVSVVGGPRTSHTSFRQQDSSDSDNELYFDDDRKQKSIRRTNSASLLLIDNNSRRTKKKSFFFERPSFEAEQVDPKRHSPDQQIGGPRAPQRKSRLFGRDGLPPTNH